MNGFKINVRSRHPSHKVLRNNLPRMPFRSILRLGSELVLDDGKNRVELNSVNSISISKNKRLMKEKFNEANVPTPVWVNANSLNTLIGKINSEEIRYPIVCKSLFGSRGEGNTIIYNEKDLNDWSTNRNFNSYIFENYMNYMLEYRLHITKFGCFYACRKALRSDAPDDAKWRRHADNSVWLLEDNPNFFRPNSWTNIVNDCVKALKTIGADILSFDIRVQSSRDSEGRQREFQKYILIECNSASSMKSPSNKEISICAHKYLEMIPKLLIDKKENS